MGGIVLRIAQKIVAMAIVMIEVAAANLGAQIMQIAALGVDKFTEEAFTDHAQQGQLRAAIAAILEQHDRSARALVGIYQLPALVDAVRRRRLHGQPGSSVPSRTVSADASDSPRR